MKKNGFLAALGLFLMAGSACAQKAPATGVYVGAGVSMAIHDKDKFEGGGIAHSDGYGLYLPGKLYAGYAFDQNWALELGRTDFGRNEFDHTSPVSTGSFRTRLAAHYVAAKYGMALDQNWTVFGKLGMSYNTQRFRDSGPMPLTGKSESNGAYLGAGVEYAVTPNAGIVLEYENAHHMKPDGGRLGAVSVSGRWRF